MTIDETTMRRLAIIKYMYDIAVEQSHKSEPWCSLSVLTFHDAIELFLELSCRTLDVDTENVGFITYWNRLNTKLKEMKREGEITQKASMQRLNKARVGLKHYGTMPSRLEIEAFRSNVTSFFEENTPTIFSIKFSSISLIEVIQCEATKINLKEAEDMLEKGKIKDALDKVAVAFAQLIDDYENRKRGRFGRSPFFFGRSMTFLDSFSMRISRTGSGFEGKLAEFVDKTGESVEAIQDAVKILSLGIDYRRYAKFRLLTPDVMLTSEGYYVQEPFWGSRGKPTEEDARFCINFVIESATTLQEFDFRLD